MVLAGLKVRRSLGRVERVSSFRSVDETPKEAVSSSRIFSRAGIQGLRFCVHHTSSLLTYQAEIFRGPRIWVGENKRSMQSDAPYSKPSNEHGKSRHSGVSGSGCSTLSFSLV